jgi:hypothetical protein
MAQVVLEKATLTDELIVSHAIKKGRLGFMEGTGVF